MGKTKRTKRGSAVGKKPVKSDRRGDKVDGRNDQADKKPKRSVSFKTKSKAKVLKQKAKKVSETVKADAEDQLRKEVFALGGDEEDLRLIQEADQTPKDRMGAAKPKEVVTAEEFSAQARRELEDLIKNLGLDKKFKEGVSKDEGDEEEGGDDFEVAESSDDESVQVDEVSSTTVAEEEKEAPEGQEQGGADRPTKRGKDGDSDSDAKRRGPEYHFLKERPSRKHCVVKTQAGSKWFEILPDCHGGEWEAASSYWVPKLEKYAGVALELECHNFQAASQRGASKSEMGYINSVLKSGAVGDKVSAYTVLLQENPVQNLRALDSLVSMVSLKSRRLCLMAMDALKDLFVNYLLAEGRKLRTFAENPFCKLGELSSGNRDTRDKYLILWLFEHRLKEAYGRFLAAVDEVAKDTIENTKTKVMSVYLETLMSNPEREAELLERLVNKLGDPSRSVAAKAMYQLRLLLGEHPAMKGVVLREVERLLYRSNVGKKAQYFGICFLSQILLEQDESSLANRLIGIYFGFFKANVKKGDIDSKLMSALLTGVNRAFPYATMAKDKLEDQTQIMFKLVHMLSNFNASVQCLTLLYQIMDSGESASDRFYTALYRKVMDSGLSSSSSSKIAVLLNLLFKSMKKDPSINRIKAFIKRLLQVSLGVAPEMTCGILFLISEVIRSRKDLSSDAGIASMLRNTGEGTIERKVFEGDADSDGEEHYEDVKEENDDIKQEIDEAEEPKPRSGSWVHRRNLRSGGPSRGARGKGGGQGSAGYDPHHRNPAFCGAERSALWELRQLSSHVHPTVALFAGNLLDGVPIKYGGDPLMDFTLIRFLDRFVFRNPKKDPLKGKPSTVLSRRRQYVPKGVKAVAPDSREYANLAESAVPMDERFIFKYFAEKRAREDVDADSDADSVTSEDFDAFMDGYFRKKGSKVEEEGLSEGDLDFAGNVGSLEEEGGESDEEEQYGESSEDGSGEEPELEGEDDDDGDGDGLDLEDIEDVASGDNEGDEFDEENFANSDNDEDEAEMPGRSQKGKRKAPLLNSAFGKKAKKLRKGGSGNNLQDLLASAEEFADLVEQAAADDVDLGGAGAMSNVRDRAGKKQLQWEGHRGREKEKKGNWAKGKAKARGGKARRRKK